MRGWNLSDIEKLSARGFRVNVAPIPKEIPVSKTISFAGLTHKAQSEFNMFIRNRDMDKGCISCQSGKVEQASHFLSAGQFSALRFNEDNCHGSCLRCNYFLSGNLIFYREWLIKKIGVERLLILENKAKLNRVHKWSRFELELIYKMYKQRNESRIKGSS